MALITNVFLSPAVHTTLGYWPTNFGHKNQVIGGVFIRTPLEGGATVFDGLARDCAAQKLPTYITDHLTLI